MYPALAVLEALEGKVDELLWVGGEGGMEAKLVQRLNIPFQTIPAAGVHGIGIRTLPANLFKLARGVAASRRILKQFKPQTVVFTGGFVATPMAIAARRIPSLLFVPDIEPGLALKFIARFASKIALTTMKSSLYFNDQKRLVETGYPIRTELRRINKSTARTHFELNSEKPVVLVLGGSKGAHTINQALTTILPELLKITQVIHISGALDWPSVQKNLENLPAQLQSSYKVFPYLHEEMGIALSAADLVISRAGASILGEYPLFQLPAILIPYPYAWQYQKVNAQFLTDKDAALMIKDEEMASLLYPTLEELLVNPQKLTKMAANMSQLFQPHAAEKIAELIIEISRNAKSERGTA